MSGERRDIDAPLANLVVVLADTKYFLGRRLSEWAIGAPTLEAGIACAAIAQEELGHTRPLYSYLSQLDVPNGPVPLERDDDRERKYCLSFLRTELRSWSFAVAALLLVDSALTIMLEGLAGTSGDVLGRRAARLIADEPTHHKFAVGRVRELEAAGATRELAAAAAEIMPETLCWFGPAAEPGAAALQSAGLVAVDADRLRQLFLDRVMPVLALADVTGGIGWSPEQRRWHYDDLPWERWNALERNLRPARPATAR
ncbi:MAG: Phenylacetic acid catabolic protein [Gaiellales bacterium]